MAIRRVTVFGVTTCATMGRKTAGAIFNKLQLTASTREEILRLYNADVRTTPISYQKGSYLMVALADAIGNVLDYQQGVRFFTHAATLAKKRKIKAANVDEVEKSPAKEVSSPGKISSQDALAVFKVLRALQKGGASNEMIGRTFRNSVPE